MDMANQRFLTTTNLCHQEAMLKKQQHIIQQQQRKIQQRQKQLHLLTPIPILDAVPFRAKCFEMNCYILAGEWNRFTDAMERYQNDIFLVESACLLIAIQSANASATADAIINAGGVVAVINAMKKHVNDTSVQIHACGALALLSGTSQSNALSVVTAGGYEALSSASISHPHVAPIQSMGHRALHNMGLPSLAPTASVNKPVQMITKANVSTQKAVDVPKQTDDLRRYKPIIISSHHKLKNLP